MRHGLALLGLLIATPLMSTAAMAQNYPWCAYYSPPGGTNCGFSTFAQCLADVSGIGGFCQPNTQYRAAAPRPRRGRKPY